MNTSLNPAVPTNPSSVLPQNLLRGGQTSPAQLMQGQNPLATGVSPSSPTFNPANVTPPPPGSQAQSQMMQPPQGTQPGSPQLPGQPQPMDESSMILNALIDRLGSHSKISEKSVNSLLKILEAHAIPPEQQDQQQGSPPTA